MNPRKLVWMSGKFIYITKITDLGNKAKKILMQSLSTKIHVSYFCIHVNRVIALVHITRIRIQHNFVLDPIFSQSLRFFLLYNMKSSHIEKDLSYRLVNTVEISVNPVVVIIKMGLSRHEVYQTNQDNRRT